MTSIMSGFRRSRKDRFGSRAAVAGRLVAQPVYPQLRKYPVRSGTNASCQKQK
jgi:hypothetical protein